jgi:CRP/FNR family transcriptional regulator, anaerobic regulatory protein
MQDTSTTTVQPLLDYFSRLIPLSKEEKDFITAKFRPHLFLKKQFGLQHGQVCEHFDFVVRGCSVRKKTRVNESCLNAEPANLGMQ